MEAAEEQLWRGAKRLAAMLGAELGFAVQRGSGEGTRRAVHARTVLGGS